MENIRCPAAKAAAARDVGSRRVLRDIRNVVGEQPPHPCAAMKNENDDGFDVTKPALVARCPITRWGKSSASSVDKENSSQKIKGDCERTVIDWHAKIAMSSPSVRRCEGSKSLNGNIDRTDDKDSSELEVDMKDIAKETSQEDIDISDSNDPLAAVEYVEDIYQFYRDTELAGCVQPDYMSNQEDINERMRAILIDWLVEVHYKFLLMDETLYLTVNILDRFLASQSVKRKKLQLVGVTALLLACKYEDVSVPVVEDLTLISDPDYSREEILEMERMILRTLQFNFSVPTPYVFMRRFLKAARCNHEQLELLSFYIVELCLIEYQMLRYRPSLLAAAAIYTAQCSLKGHREWTKTSELHTRYSESDLIECSKLMVEFHRRAGTGKLNGVNRKYSSSRFGVTARSQPALFLLEQ